MWPAGYVSPVINSPVLMSLHDTLANNFFLLLLQTNYRARSQALEQQGCHVSHVTAWLAAQPARAAGASRSDAWVPLSCGHLGRNLRHGLALDRSEDGMMGSSIGSGCPEGI